MIYGSRADLVVAGSRLAGSRVDALGLPELLEEYTARSSICKSLHLLISPSPSSVETKEGLWTEEVCDVFRQRSVFNKGFIFDSVCLVWG